MSDTILNETRQKMEKAIEALQREMAKLRTGRASLSMLDEVRVDYYGDKVPLNQVGTLSVPEPRMIAIAPWESTVIPAIEKAIQSANLGLSPINDGKLVRIPIPMLTEERRRDIVKMLKTHGEEARVAVRHARRDAIDEIKKNEKESKLSEDESKKAQTLAQKLTDDYVAKIDASVQKKEQEIMTV